MTNRKKKIVMYLNVAKAISKSGTCKRMQVGAVIVRGGAIIGTGYNGSARGEEHCKDVGCDMEHGHCVRCVHAETNAILNAARSGASTDGAFVVCTHHPCHRCARNLINSGIHAVFYDKPYDDKRSVRLDTKGLITFHCIKEMR